MYYFKMPVMFKEDTGIKSASLCYEKYGEKAFWDESENKCYNIDGWERQQRARLTITPKEENEEILGIFSKREKDKRFIVVKTNRMWYAEVTSYDKRFDFLPTGSASGDTMENAIVGALASLTVTMALSKK